MKGDAFGPLRRTNAIIPGARWPNLGFYAALQLFVEIRR